MCLTMGIICIALEVSIRDLTDALKEALGRYALGANVLKDTYRFLGFKADTAAFSAPSPGVNAFVHRRVDSGFSIDIGRWCEI